MSVATVTATVDASNVPPRVRLDVADTGSPAFASVTVTRMNPDGTTVSVRTTDGNPLPMSGGTALVYDVEPPYGQPVTYSTLETPANVTTPVTVPATDVWLTHPGVPALSMPITLRPGSLDDEIHGVQQGVFYPMGRKTPIVVTSGARRDPSTQLVVSTETSSERAALRALVADASVLYLNVSPSLGLDFDTCYIAINDVKVSRRVSMAGEVGRDVTLPFVTVARPAGGSQSQRTYTDLLVYPTYSALQAAYVDYAALLAGP